MRTLVKRVRGTKIERPNYVEGFDAVYFRVASMIDSHFWIYHRTVFNATDCSYPIMDTKYYHRVDDNAFVSAHPLSVDELIALDAMEDGLIEQVESIPGLFVVEE